MESSKRLFGVPNLVVVFLETEARLLSKVEHRNLVGLVGFCEEPGMHQKMSNLLFQIHQICNQLGRFFFEQGYKERKYWSMNMYQIRFTA